jgi:hypothetical protein
MNTKETADDRKEQHPFKRLENRMRRIAARRAELTALANERTLTMAEVSEWIALSAELG